ncbi:MAG: PQQ-like beta-propeller repeat protein [Planctomycetes bacterium]|nr:PQQ-like beta-propeller repeat protein [Planctomycetota bacterium]
MRVQALLMSVVFVLTAGAFAGDWPQFLGPDRNGESGETHLARTFGPDGPPTLWTVNLGVGFGGPCVQAGKVYVLDRQAGKADVLRCFDLADGRELWQFSYSAPGIVDRDHPGSRSTPAADDKYVFTIGPFGDMHCVSTATHKSLWSKHLLREFGGKRPNWAASQSPLLYKDMVIVAPLGRTAGVVALAKDTGQIVWKSPPLGAMNHCSPMLMTLAGVEQIVVISGSGDKTRVAGVDATSGKILWEYAGWQCAIPVPGPTPIDERRIFITGGYRADSVMLELRREDGKFVVTELFRKDALGSQISNPVCHEGHLYFNSFTNENSKVGIVCLDLAGQEKWTSGTLGEAQSPFNRGNLILADGLIYIIDAKGGLRIIEANPVAYKQLHRVQMLEGNELWAPLALSEGRLIIRGQAQMKCLDLRPNKNP